MSKVAKYSFMLVLTLGVAFGAFFGVSQISAQPAQASTSCAGTSICLSIHKGWVGDSNQAGNTIGGKPPSGGGSTVAKPTPIPCVSASNVQFIEPGQSLPYSSTGWRSLRGCVKKYKVTSTFVPFAVPGGWCGSITKSGVQVKAVGYILNSIQQAQFIQKLGPDGNSLSTAMLYGYAPKPSVINCIYPKLNAVVNNKYCALHANITFDRLDNSRAGAGRVKSAKEVITTMGKLENGTGVCKQSMNIAFSTGLKSNPNTWGQYKLAGQIHFARCTEFKTSFDGKVTTEYAKCSSAQAPAVAAYASLWCGGVKHSLINKTWTMNDCYDRPTGGYTCTVPNATFDGKTGNVQTIRDGKSRVLNWGKPNTGSSIRNTTGWEQTVTVDKGSSPRNTNVSDNNKASQYFWSNSVFGTSWNKSRNVQNMAFYNASNPNGAFKATRKLRFDGQFKTLVADVTSYNPWSGKMGTKNRTVWVNDYNIKCETAVSPRIQAIRSIGDVQ